MQKTIISFKVNTNSSQLFRTRKILSVFIVSVILLISSVSTAQHTINSLYSRYGIGDLVKKGFGQNRAMGGLAIGVRTPSHLNITNPASYSALHMQTFTFDVGLSTKLMNYETNSRSQPNRTMNVSFLTMGFPITKWWFTSVGLLPYSKVGYNIETYNDSNIETIGTIERKFEGSGGLNQLYWGSSFRIHKKLSLGFNVSYLFGPLEHNDVTVIQHGIEVTTITNEDKYRIKDFHIGYGLQFSHIFNEKYSIDLGVIFDNKNNIDTERTAYSFQSYFLNGRHLTYPYSLLQVLDTLKAEINDDGIEIPRNFGAGFTIRNGSKLMVGLDYSEQDWSKAVFFSKKDPALTKSSTIAFGAQIIPQAGSPSYFKNIRYRFGGHYSKTYYNIPLKGEFAGQNENLKEFGISFGLGLPTRTSRTIYNLAVEFGQRGTTDYNLLLEEYVIITLNLSLQDVWFIKRKFH